MPLTVTSQFRGVSWLPQELHLTAVAEESTAQTKLERRMKLIKNNGQIRTTLSFIVVEELRYL